jgi:2-hydroxy-6-oxonona-2,4-dienedioate hydrolase
MGKSIARMLMLSLVLLAATSVQAFAAQTGTQTTSAFPEKDVTIYGQRIHYIDAGTGPAVILLHGLGGSTLAWLPNIGPLAAKFRVVVPDQLGFGKSDKPVIAYRIGTYVDFLEEFRKQLKIERVALVGNSMGGWIAAAYAVSYPDRVERIVLEDAAGFAPPPNFDMKTLYALNPSTRAGMKAVVAKVFYNPLFSSDLVVDQALTQRLSAGDGYTINSLIESISRGEDFLDGRIKSIKQPTLIIWGRQDGLTPISDGERFHREIPGSTLVVMEECGHVPNIEKAAEFNAAVLKFLSGQ